MSYHDDAWHSVINSYLPFTILLGLNASWYLIWDWTKCEFVDEYVQFCTQAGRSYKYIRISTQQVAAKERPRVAVAS